MVASFRTLDVVFIFCDVMFVFVILRGKTWTILDLVSVVWYQDPFDIYIWFGWINEIGGLTTHFCQIYIYTLSYIFIDNTYVLTKHS